MMPSPSAAIVGPDAPAAERVATTFFTNCLVGDGSVLTPGSAIWTLENLAELHRHYVDAPDVSARSFAKKVQLLLAEVSDNARQLFAELYVLNLLPVSKRDFTPATKRRFINEILDPITPTIAIPNEIEDAFADGVLVGGGAWRSRRWAQLSFLVEFAEQFKQQDSGTREGAGSDPLLLRRLVLEAKGQPEPEQRHALLYLFHPEYFMPIVSIEDRTRLRNALAADFLPAGPTDAIAADLRLVEDAVRVREGGPVDYFLPPWRHRWLDDAAQPSGANGADAQVPAEAPPPPSPRLTPEEDKVRYHPMAPGTYSVSSGYRTPDRPDHRGVDFAANPGTPIYAPANGSLVHVGINDDPQGFGSWLVLHPQDEWGLDFVFGHTPPSSFVNPDTGQQWKPGDGVRAGQQIAVVGTEGGSTGPHLHFETWGPPGRFGGNDVDPNKAWLADAVDPREAVKVAPAPSLTGEMLVDFSAGVPAAENIASQGFIGAIRYISDPREEWMHGKPLQKQEADAIRARGMVVVSNFQYGKSDWAGGADPGRRGDERAEE